MKYVALCLIVGFLGFLASVWAGEQILSMLITFGIAMAITVACMGLILYLKNLDNAPP